MISLDNIDTVDMILVKQCQFLQQAKWDNDWLRVMRIRENIDSLLDERWAKMGR